MLVNLNSFWGQVDLSLTPVQVTRIYESQHKDLLMLPSVWFFLQLFVSHLVRMVFVTDQVPVSVSPGGLAADAEQVIRDAL